jgi:hypothetical protein
MRYLCGRDVGRTRLDRPRIYPLLHVVNGLSPAQDLGLLSHGGGSWSLRASASGMGGRQTTGDRLSSPGTLQNLFAHAMGALIAAPPGHDPTILAKPGLPTPPRRSESALLVRVEGCKPHRPEMPHRHHHDGGPLTPRRAGRALPARAQVETSVSVVRAPTTRARWVRVTGRPCRSCQPELTRSESGGICFIWHPSDGLQSPQGAHCR